MTDPFSKLTRKFIPWLEHKRLSAMLVENSLVSRREIEEVELKFRIQELNEYEERFGFVYLGERKWLESSGIASSRQSYSDWAMSQLEKAVFLDGLLFDENSKKGQWIGYTEDLSPLRLFTELKEKSIGIDNLKLLIPGDFSKVAPSRLCQAFEILHNLAYYLHIALQGAPQGKGDDEMWLDEIVLHVEKGRWDMWLINGYGSLGQVAFLNSTIVFPIRTK